MRKNLITFIVLFVTVTVIGICNIIEAQPLSNVPTAAYTVPADDKPLMLLFHTYAGHTYDVLINGDSYTDTYLYSVDTNGNSHFVYHSDAGITITARVSTAYYIVVYPRFVGAEITALIVEVN